MSEPEPPEDQLMREAASWFARMRGPDAEVSRDAFEAWLRRGALHRSAYNRAAEIFALGKLLAGEVPAPAREATASRRPVAAASFAGLFALACAATFLALPDTRDPARRQRAAEGAGSMTAQRFTTEAAETRSVRLADGSTVMLGPATVLEARLGRAGRHLQLLRGAARFDVFHERRPFAVWAGGGRVVARGTRFDVAIAADRQVTVRLLEGRVDVDLPGRTDRAPSSKLRPGETLTFIATGAAPPERGPSAGLSPRDNGGSMPFPQAASEFDGISLARLVALANRAAVRPIRLLDTDIGMLRVSGRFRVNDTALLAERLALLFALEADYSRPEAILLRRR